MWVYPNSHWVNWLFVLQLVRGAQVSTILSSEQFCAKSQTGRGGPFNVFMDRTVVVCVCACHLTNTGRPTQGLSLETQICRRLSFFCFTELRFTLDIQVSSALKSWRSGWITFLYETIKQNSNDGNKERIFGQGWDSEWTPSHYFCPFIPTYRHSSMLDTIGLGGQELHDSH